MPNEEVLGTRKTVVVLAIVVGCFAALWPRLLSPLLFGPSLPPEPGPLDRPPGLGCCEVLFEPEVAVLELVRAVCGSAGTPAANECRKALNSTCGLDVAAAIFRPENIGKSAKSLLEALKASNFSCLKENFGVSMWTLAVHPALNSWILNDTIKQERRGPVGALHPALRERGRAIPSEIPLPPRGAPPLPHHARVRSSPQLEGYFQIDFPKPPPIPGMRPPMGAGAGPQPTPKSSMGFVMPVYTICIIVFFVYTLSKIVFKPAGCPYDQVTPDPYFRARVFRDRSRESPETKLGDEEVLALRAKLAETERAMQRLLKEMVVTGISGLVAEVHRQMEANYALNRSQDAADDNGQVYKNGNVPKEQHIYAEELRETKKAVPPREPSPEPKEPTPEPKELSESPKELSPSPKELTPSPKELSPSPKELISEPKEASPEGKEPSPEIKGITPERQNNTENDLIEDDDREHLELIKLSQSVDIGKETDSIVKMTEELLREEKQSTPELLEEALREDALKYDIQDEEEDELENDNGTVKVLGMETRAHTADGGEWPRDQQRSQPVSTPAASHTAVDPVSEIYLQRDIPAESRVLVADFASKSGRLIESPRSPSPLVVSGKMTLSLVQDQPRETPERDLTVSEWTTADDMTSAPENGLNHSVTGQKSNYDVEEDIEDLSEEEVEVEEIEIEEEEEIEDENDEAHRQDLK